MSTVLKIKCDPKRGGPVDYDSISPALLVGNWPHPVFTLLESSDDISYTVLDEGIDWNADFDWAASKLRIHILKDYTQVVYLALATAHQRLITVAFDISGDKSRLIPAAWDTGSLERLNVLAAYDILGDRGLNIPAGYYGVYRHIRNIPVGYGISTGDKKLITVAFDIGTPHARRIAAGCWVMGVAGLPSDATILPQSADPASSRVKGRTKKITLTGNNWEVLD